MEVFFVNVFYSTEDIKKHWQFLFTNPLLLRFVNRKNFIN